ncbi:hypothetical protein B0T19DRAFT_173248 [Cercophora scortea]|uniref:Uncharacterized protein n=1 Tax=Cercophora scortea TaxID=314031 RepID=A0AAE0IMZ4_9PEZI|nr:hypothetical protein B0T19DRAFT_173248 [Cercophora scortea]
MDNQAAHEHQWEELVLSGRISKYFTMNWTDGKLNRSYPGRLRKPNATRQRQREYSARARLRAEEHKAAVENGPPSLSIFRASSSSSSSSRSSRSSRRSQISSHSGRSSPTRRAPQTASQQKTEHRKKRQKTTSPGDEPLFPTISDFLEERAAREAAGLPPDPPNQYDEEAIREIRRSLLASKDWGISRVPTVTSTRKRLAVPPGNRVPSQDHQSVRQKPQRLLDNEYAAVKRRRQLTGRPLRYDDVKIRIGSQEKHLGESSSISKSRVTRTAREPQTHINRLVKEHAPLTTRNLRGVDSHTSRHQIVVSQSSSLLGSSIITDEGKNPRMSARLPGPIVTTTPRMVHPIPLRVIPKHLFTSPTIDSANTNSLIAQVGRVISPVPLSQKAENDTWRRWLEQSSSVIPSCRAVEGSLESSEELQISPGPSQQCRLVRDESQSLPSLDDKSHPERPLSVDPDDSRAGNILSSSDFSEIISQYDEIVDRFARSPCESRGQQPGQAKQAGSHPHDSSFQSCAEPCRIEHTRQAVAHIPPNPLEARTGVAAERPTVQGDAEEAWKAFVFGDQGSDDFEEATFNEAKQEAARDLRPSECSTCISSERNADQTPLDNGKYQTATSRQLSDCSTFPSDEAAVGVSYDDRSERVENTQRSDYSPCTSEGMMSARDSSISSNIATVGTLRTNHDADFDFADGLVSTAGASASRKATFGSSLTGMGSVLTSDSSDVRPEIDVDAGTSSDSGIGYTTSGRTEPIPAEMVRSSSSGGQTHSMAGAPSIAASMTVEPPRSEVGVAEPGEQFRFAPPKLFVGSRSSLTQTYCPMGASAPISLTRKRRGRQRKRALDGRADIRALPNYTNDPIEEIEDDFDQHPSLFGALEME